VTLCKAYDIKNKQLKLQLVATLLQHKGNNQGVNLPVRQKKTRFWVNLRCHVFCQIYQRTNSKAITLYLKGKVHNSMRFRR